MNSSEQIDPALPMSDKWFQILLETLPHIAFLIGPTGSAEYYNQRFIDYLGFQPGISKASRTALHHPDDQAQLVAARAAGVGFDSEYIVEARLKRHDGAYRWHRIHNKPLFHADRCIGWLGTAVDVHDVRQANEALEQRVAQRTAELEESNRRLQAEIEQRRSTEAGLRQSEVRFRTMYNRTPMALHSVDADARLLDVNDTWTELFGHSREDVIGRSPTDFMTPESAELYRRQAWPEMLHSNGQARTVDYQFRNQAGRIFDGRLASRGEFDATGRFVRSWSAIADVTAEKRADQELRQAQRMEAVGQLTAGIAHDFNNLLTAILGNLELLANQPIRDDMRSARLLTGARTAAERGARLTGQLLAFSRQQRIVAEPVDLNQVIQDMHPLLRATIGSNIGIDIVTDPELYTALADTGQLELAVLNLVINARDAIACDGTITISTSNVTRDAPVLPEEPACGEYVAVSVSDTGAGMPDAVRERMFEPFFTTKEIGKGSGLGLPQVLGVVKQLGGGITVRSAPGHGTSVSILLPRSQHDAVVTPATTRDEDAANVTRRSRERIMLVDDDADVRMIAADMLLDAGYEVIEAASGPAALELLAADDRLTNAMVVDVVMPAMTGVELATIVHSTRPLLPVIFMTGYAAAHVLPTGAGYEVLRKPFQAADLEARVAQALGRSAG